MAREAEQCQRAGPGLGSLHGRQRVNTMRVSLHRCVDRALCPRPNAATPRRQHNALCCCPGPRATHTTHVVVCSCVSCGAASLWGAGLPVAVELPLPGTAGTMSTSSALPGEFFVGGLGAYRALTSHVGRNNLGNPACNRKPSKSLAFFFICACLTLDTRWQEYRVRKLRSSTMPKRSA